MSEKYIGISEDRLHYILGVARKCYQIAKCRGYDEEFCRKMFTIGWNHDIGYEFSAIQSEHPERSAELMEQLGVQDEDTIHAVRKHGLYTENKTSEWEILNIADMTTDSKGNDVSVSIRLEDIKDRYGEYSDQYLTACDLAYQLGLTAVNFGSLTV